MWPLWNKDLQKIFLIIIDQAKQSYGTLVYFFRTTINAGESSYLVALHISTIFKMTQWSPLVIVLQGILCKNIGSCKGELLEFKPSIFRLYKNRISTQWLLFGLNYSYNFEDNTMGHDRYNHPIFYCYARHIYIFFFEISCLWKESYGSAFVLITIYTVWSTWLELLLQISR